jgi:hypothetical protein
LSGIFGNIEGMANRQYRVEISKNGYLRRMPFNRYSIERIDGMVIMHFGFMTPSGALLDNFICAITQVELENQKKSLMDYLGKTGALDDPPPAWQPPPGIHPIDLCNHIGLCGNPDIGEITLNNIVGRDLVEMKPQQITVVAEAIAILRSQMNIQKHWIKDIFK